MTYQRSGVEAFFGFSRGVLAMLLGVILVVGVAIGLVAFSLFGGSAGNSASSGTRSSNGGSTHDGPCTEVPQVTAKSASVDPSGFRLTAELSTTCSGGAVVSGPSVQVLGSVGNRDFVSGVFDLSSNPITIPGDQQVERAFVFPLRAYWRIPALLGNDTMQVELRGTQTSSASGSGSSSGGAVVATAPAPPAHGDSETVALGAMQEIAASDYPFVKGNLADRWVPQIGSKKYGIFAEGKTFTNAEMLFDHLNYRARYDDVRLVQSGQWTTFNDSNFWVTVVGDTYPSGDGANGWCDSHGIDAFNCFAKLISDSRGPSGTMVMRN